MSDVERLKCYYCPAEGLRFDVYGLAECPLDGAWIGKSVTCHIPLKSMKLVVEARLARGEKCES